MDERPQTGLNLAAALDENAFQADRRCSVLTENVLMPKGPPCFELVPLSQWAPPCVVVIIIIAGAANVVADQADNVQAEDPAGDQRLMANGNDQGPAPDGYDSADLVRTTATIDSQQNLEITMQTAGAPALNGNGELAIAFKFIDVEFQILYMDCTEEHPFTLLQRPYNADRPQDWMEVQCLPGSVDQSAGVLLARAPMAAITGSNGERLIDGGTLQGFYAEGNVSLLGFRDDVYVYDRLPDRDTFGPMEVPGAGPGTARSFRLSTPTPNYVSAGETPVAHFPIDFTSYSPEGLDIALNGTQGEGAFDLVYPPLVHIPAGETVSAGILVETTVEHEHGTTAGFQLTGLSVQTQESVTVDFELEWPSYPQPAAHHSVLYLHSHQRGTEPDPAPQATWTNTLRDDPNPDAADEPVPPTIRVQPSQPVRLNWTFDLMPALQVGLAFDGQTAGKFEGVLRTKGALPDATVRAQVLFCDPSGTMSAEVVQPGCPGGAWVRLAAGDERLGNLMADTDYDFSVGMEGADLGNHVPPSAAGNLRLALTLTAGLPAVARSASADLVVQESMVFLPLKEYLEPIEDESLHSGGLSVKVEPPAIRLMNPGRTSVFNLTVVNERVDTPLTLEPVVLASHGEWAWWAQQPERTLAPGEPWDIQLAVKAPSDARAGERFDGFAGFSANEPPFDSGFARLRATVTDSVDVPDQEGQILAKPGEAATAVSLVATLIFLGLAVVMSDRRFR